ncbi:MAG: hypothetical protein WA594_09275 [Candidatus Sulfotelmatobacter sp.]
MNKTEQLSRISIGLSRSTAIIVKVRGAMAACFSWPHRKPIQHLNPVSNLPESRTLNTKMSTPKKIFASLHDIFASQHDIKSLERRCKKNVKKIMKST